MPSTPSEKGCLSESRRRSVSERTGRPVGLIAQELKVAKSKIQNYVPQPERENYSRIAGGN